MANSEYLRLLIVEDEPNIRNRLALMVDWDAIGVRIVGEASTGLEALQFLEDQLPDIVMTDIEMPYMDGLTLSRKILERYRDIAVIILTAHDQFSYAQQALKIGVSNYLLKPIDKEKVEQALFSAAQTIRENRSKLTKMELSYQYIISHRQLFRDRSLEELIHRGYTDVLDDVLGMVGIKAHRDAPYMLALISALGAPQSPAVTKKYVFLNNCRAYIEETYAKEDNLYVFFDGMDTLALLAYNPTLDMSDICRQMATVTETGQQYRMYYGLSHSCHDLAHLPTAYTQAREALRLAMMAGQGAIPESTPPEWDLRALEDGMSELLLCVKSGLQDKAVLLCRSLMQAAAVSQDGDLNAVTLLAFRMVTDSVNTLAGQGIPWLTLVTIASSGYEQFLRVPSLARLEDLLSEQILELSRLAQTNQQQQTHAVTSKMIRYLEENFSNPDLSLAFMAQKYNCNSSYLSRIFKAYTGKSFSEYLIEIRIQKSKEFLKKNNYKAYQLAQEVGIPDPGYFTKCFKKVTGVSFQAYKAERKKD